MKYNKLSRRHFLQGAGGTFLALPFLPSLMSNAEAATVANPKLMVAFWNSHGGMNLQNFHPVLTNPAVAAQLRQTTIYPTQNHVINSARLTALKTTRASNLAYLDTTLDANSNKVVTGQLTADSYALSVAGNDVDNGAPRVTPIVGSFMSDSLLNKMNLITGLDMIFNSGHNYGQLGNFCNIAGISASSVMTMPGMNNVWVPSIDAVATKYPGFYGNNRPAATTVILNSVYGATEAYAVALTAMSTPNGIVNNNTAPASVGDAFNLLFGSLGGGQSQAGNAKRNFILNKVHEDYTRVAKGAYGPGRRIGKTDRNRLEEFVSNVDRLIAGVSATGANCSIPNILANDKSNVVSGLADPTPNISAYHLYNQLMVAAFSCGLTQQFIFAVPNLADPFVPAGSPGQTFAEGNGVTGPDTHQALFHQLNYSDRQSRLLHGHRFFFQYGFADLMQQMDAVTMPAGGTMLDAAFLFWTQEAGYVTHNGNCLPMIQAGGAGGFIKTGNYVDYRNPNQTTWVYGQPWFHVGLPYNRFLGTALQALGVPPSAYELSQGLFAGTTGPRIPVTSRGTVPGYGHPFQTTHQLSQSGPNVYPYDYQLNDMSVPLPIIT